MITPYELQNLNDANAGKIGNAIVLALGKNPLKAIFTPCFKAKNIYTLKKSALADVDQSEFDEKKLWVDITKIKNTVETKSLEQEQIEEENLIETEDDAEKVKETDEMYEMLSKRLNSLKTALKPYLSTADFEELMNSDPITILELLETLVDKLLKKDVVAGVMGIELRNFIQNKILDYAESDMNTA